MFRTALWSRAALVSLALAWECSTAKGDFVVAPSGSASAPGDSQGPSPFRYYGFLGGRTQTVYDSSNFGSSGPELISAIQFRPYPGSAPNLFIGNNVTFSDTSISLSTTSRSGEGLNMLSQNFADNIGSDAQSVFTGPLTLTTSATPAAGGTNAFDYTINLKNPFLYDPSKGNLLLDVKIPATATVTGSGIFGFVTFDTVNDVNDGVFSVINGLQGDAPSGTLDTSGAIARFTFTPVPEPASLGLLILGIGGLGLPVLLKRGKTQRES